MKKLLKNVICGSVNSALFTEDRSTVAAEKEKQKKKRENALDADATLIIRIQTPS